eukprot:CAMPEP_0196656088 /NCGR_PEP_ID=MMETSP1086-20130531/13186_1 /TAXON_ID=77921 /ORGANISM="Cyanoptyche  gloeocystis , Strain SAG4.97" /LENGTH=127 /DNA_ID=CAMNT_0041988699 /DNA_START=56 /DNA_END=441 /DNA_ORIENTATION=-
MTTFEGPPDSGRTGHKESMQGHPNACVRNKDSVRERKANHGSESDEGPCRKANMADLKNFLSGRTLVKGEDLADQFAPECILENGEENGEGGNLTNAEAEGEGEVEELWRKVVPYNSSFSSSSRGLV